MANRGKPLILLVESYQKILCDPLPIHAVENRIPILFLGKTREVHASSELLDPH